jgi:hypothetical protein
VQTTKKLHPALRLLLVLVGLYFAVQMAFSYKVARAINNTYFPASPTPIGALDVLSVLLLLYLFAVAVTGRWQLIRWSRK